MSKHTPEPWRYRNASVLAEGLVDTFHDSVLGTIAHCEKLTQSDGEGRTWTTSGDPHANAKRIALCVNACTGIPTEALKEVAVKELVEAAEEARSVLAILIDPDSQHVSSQTVFAQAFEAEVKTRAALASFKEKG